MKLYKNDQIGLDLIKIESSAVEKLLILHTTVVSDFLLGDRHVFLPCTHTAAATSTATIDEIDKIHSDQS